MFEVMAVSIENLLCSSVTGPQSRYNRECLILISNMGFQFWAIWAALGSKGNFFNDATLKTGINVRVGLFIFENV